MSAATELRSSKLYDFSMPPHSPVFLGCKKKIMLLYCTVYSILQQYSNIVQYSTVQYVQYYNSIVTYNAILIDSSVVKNLTNQRGKHHKSAGINQLKNLNNQIYSGFPVKKLQQNTPNQTYIGSFIQEASYCTMNNRVGQFSSFSLVFT